MDGTVLREDHSISPCTLTTFRTLFEYTSPKIHLAICTGRPYKDIHARHKQLQLPKCYTVTSNGACVHDQDGHLLHIHDIDENVAKELVCLESDNCDIATSIWQGETWRMNKEAEDLQCFYEPLGAWRYSLFDPKTHSDYNGIHKIYWTSRTCPSVLSALCDKVRSKFGNLVDVICPLPYCVEVMAKGVNKAEGIQFVLSDIAKHCNDTEGSENDNNDNNNDNNHNDKTNQVTNTQLEKKDANNNVISENVSEMNIINTTQSNEKENHSNQGTSIRLYGCIAFGDGVNDVEMISQAECGCLMGNSYSNATDVLFTRDANGNEFPITNNVCRVGKNDDDGVALKLIEVFNINMT